MTVLLDNTVLTNFSIVQRPDVVRQAFTEPIGITPIIQNELLVGVQTEQLISCDWSWVMIVSLTEIEQTQFKRFKRELGAGEASCLAVAVERGYKLATDDKEARRWAKRLRIPYTGTLGILVNVVHKQVISLDEGNRLLQRMIQASYYSPVTNLADIM